VIVPAPAFFHDRIEAVQIFQTRNVPCHRCNVFPDDSDCFLQLFLTSPGDHDVRTFFDEALGCGQANPAASACDYRNLTFKLSHNYSFDRCLVFVI
jgi:hypothetical protein